MAGGAKVSRAGLYKKGRAYEYEVRDELKAAGIDCRRVVQSGGGTEKDDLVVTSRIGELRGEAKRRAKLPAYLINDNCSFTVFRQDRGQSLVLVSLDMFRELLK